MDWYEPEVQALEQSRKAAHRSSCPAIFYGSSTLRLWNDIAGDLDIPTAVNLGFGGSTLEACVYFFDRLITPEKPCSLVLYAGDNDIGDGRQPDAIFASFRAFAQKVSLTMPGIPFGFISIKPSPSRVSLMPRMRETNRLIEEYIRTIASAYFIDIFDAMLGPNSWPRPELFEDDGLHMSGAGYRLWSKLLRPYRNQMFIPQLRAVQAVTLTSAEE